MNTLASQYFDPSPGKGIYIGFNKPLSFPGEGSPVWIVANKLSKTVQTVAGDITLNKAGAPVTFSKTIYRPLNR